MLQVGATGIEGEEEEEEEDEEEEEADDDDDDDDRQCSKFQRLVCRVVATIKKT
jgi:hypothetical protein